MTDENKVVKLKEDSFKDFLDHFQRTKLPVILGEEEVNSLATANRPFSESMLRQFIFPHQKEGVDEFTEFAPTFKLPVQPKFYGVVYWRAKLLDYHFVLATYDKSGNFIASSPVAGFRTDGEKTGWLVSTISKDFKIHLAFGQGQQNSTYNSAGSKAFLVEVQDDGQFKVSMNEDWL